MCTCDDIWYFEGIKYVFFKFYDDVSYRAATVHAHLHIYAYARVHGHGMQRTSHLQHRRAHTQQLCVYAQVQHIRTHTHICTCTPKCTRLTKRSRSRCPCTEAPTSRTPLSLGKFAISVIPRQKSVRSKSVANPSVKPTPRTQIRLICLFEWGGKDDERVVVDEVVKRREEGEREGGEGAGGRK